MPGAFPSSIAAVLRALFIPFVGALLGLFGTPVGIAVAGPGGAEPPPSETIAITKLPFAGLAGEVAADLSALILKTLHSAGFSVLPATVEIGRAHV